MPAPDVEILACSACGVVDEPVTLLVAGLREDIGLMERDLAAKRAAISRLQGERDAAPVTSLHYRPALEVLEYWKKTLSPRARECHSPKRLLPTIDRLTGGFGVSELERCVDGYARRPYVVDCRRVAHGLPSERKVDADLIFSDAKHVELGIAFADDENAVAIPAGHLARIPWRRVQAENRRLITSTLYRLFGDALVDEPWLVWPCPRCENSPASTMRVAPVGMTWLAHCSACDLNETGLLAAIVKHEGGNSHSELVAV